MLLISPSLLPCMQVDEFELAEESPVPPARVVRPAPSPIDAGGQAAASSGTAQQLHGTIMHSGSQAPGLLNVDDEILEGAAADCAATEGRQVGAGDVPGGAPAGADASEPLPAAAGDMAAGPAMQPARARLQLAVPQQPESAAPGESARAAADGESAVGPCTQAEGASEQASEAPGQAARASLEPAALPQRRASHASRLPRVSLAPEEGAYGRRSSAADGASGRCACLECCLIA